MSKNHEIHRKCGQMSKNHEIHRNSGQNCQKIVETITSLLIGPRLITNKHGFDSSLYLRFDQKPPKTVIFRVYLALSLV